MRRARRAVVALAAAAIAALPVGPAGAHTETDLVAVPAGSSAEVALRPTHGCGDAATVEVRIRAPFEGATAGDVDGWVTSATPDGEGNTVLAWTGGTLPTDETGAFPVRFDVPDEPGRLMLFPAVQRCENGEELAWISGDPTSEYPAPRVLILPAGTDPAATIDDVPADAPGREQLVAIVDVDAPGAAATTVEPTTTSAPQADATTTAAETATTTPATTAPDTATTAAPGQTVPATSADQADVTDDDGDGGSAALGIGIALLVAAVLGVVAALVVRARRR
jgi:uncharacterized protein YcnI